MFLRSIAKKFVFYVQLAIVGIILSIRKEKNYNVDY